MAREKEGAQSSGPYEQVRGVRNQVIGRTWKEDLSVVSSVFEFQSSESNVCLYAYFCLKAHFDQYCTFNIKTNLKIISETNISKIILIPILSKRNDAARMRACKPRGEQPMYPQCHSLNSLMKISPIFLIYITAYTKQNRQCEHLLTASQH